MSMYKLLVVFMVVLLGGATRSALAQEVDPPRAGPVERVEHVLGEWRVVEMGGEVMPPGMEMRLDYLEGGQLRVTRNGEPADIGTYALIGIGRLSMTVAGEGVDAGAVLDAMGRLVLRVNDNGGVTVILTRVGPPPG